MAEKVDKGKKRKRPTEESSEPSKKVAIDEDKTIKISLHDADRWVPVVGKEAQFGIAFTQKG